MRKFDIVVAVDQKLGIGKSGDMPWHLPADLAYFKKLTTSTELPRRENVVIMGRKTWESIPETFRPLPGRINVVLSSQDLHLPEGVQTASSLDDALALIQVQEDVERVFVIGGGQLYREALGHAACGRLYVTRIGAEFECDTVFPDFEDQFEVESAESPRAEGDLTFQWVVYVRRDS